MVTRDGRGIPGRYVPKNAPRLKISDIIRRRKTTLKQMIHERGVSTFAAFEEWCDRIGVLPPSKDEFDEACPLRVNSVQEGVVVLEPPRVIDDISGHEIDPEAPIDKPGITVLTDQPYQAGEPQETVPDITNRPLKTHVTRKKNPAT